MFGKLHAILTIALGTLSLGATELFVACNSTAPAPDGTQQAPFKTINQAIKKAVGGDVITVAKGTYREKLYFFAKKYDKKLTIRAAQGQRPMITGFQKLTQWTKGEDGLYRTTVAFQPRNLLVNGSYQQMARVPESGWLKMNYTGKRQFTAKTQENLVPGVTCYTWFASINVFGPQTLAKTIKPGTYELTPRDKGCGTTQNSDRFFFINHPSLIRKTGQWCWTQKDKKAYEIAIKLDTPPEKQTIEVGGSLDNAVFFRYTSNIELDGFDITGSNCGIWTFVNENLSLKNLAIYWCGTAMDLRGNTTVLVDTCRFTCNHMGLVCTDSKNVSIRNCDIGYNFSDALNITWKSKNISIENVRSHHHLWWGHPDNFQLFRAVDNVRVKDSIFYAGGQGQMTEQVSNISHENCIFVGSGAHMVIWTPSCLNVSMKNSTYLLGGYSSMLMTGKNIILDSCVIDAINFRQGKVREDMNYKAMNNHYLLRDVWHNHCDNKWHWGLDSYVKSSGDLNYTSQKLPVQGIPATSMAISPSRIDECTNDTLVIGNVNNKCQVGDNVEVRADGVKRTITKITKDSITINPPMKYAPAHAYSIFNWKEQTPGTWSSAALANKNAGSKTDLSNITMDKLASQLPIPDNVKTFIEHIDLLIPPMGF